MTDLRHAFRQLAKSPGFTAVVVLSLALGIGVNTAVFSFVNAVFLRPFPVGVKEPEALAWIFTQKTKSAKLDSLSFPEFSELAARSDEFSGLLALQPMTQFGLEHDGEIERIWGTLVSANFFSVLGVNPTLGRGFRPEEGLTPNTHPVVVLSHRLWQRRFAGDPGVIGQHVTINRHSFTVIGVAPEHFTSPLQGIQFDLYVPLMMRSVIAPDALALDDRKARDLTVLARLKPRIDLKRAATAVAARVQQLTLADPAVFTDRTARVLSAQWGNPKIIPEAAAIAASVLVMTMTLLVLLTACGNIAHLLLGRLATRRREIAIRAALGASRLQIVQQLLLESLVLSILGGAAAVALSFATLDLLGTTVQPPSDFPFGFHLRLDANVLGFTAGLSLLTSVLFGLAPALEASKIDLVATLKDCTGALARSFGQKQLRQFGVISQIAVSSLVLFVAILFLRGAANSAKIDPGFDPDGCLLLTLDLKLQGYSRTRGQLFNDQFRQRLESIPGVTAVSRAQSAPLTGIIRYRDPVVIPGDTSSAETELMVDYGLVGSHYLKTLSIPLLAGREFSAVDLKQHPGTVIINETMARRFWPKGGALGQQIRVYGPNGPFCEIVGIAKDSSYYRAGETALPFIYLPLPADHIDTTVWLVRSDTDLAATLQSARRVLRELAEGAAIFESTTLQDRLNRSFQTSQLAGVTFPIFGALILFMASAGIYGVVGLSVQQRIHEIGVRIALGARVNDIIWRVLRQGLKLAAFGTALGLGMALVTTRALAGFLPAIEPLDVPTLLSVPLMLLIATLLACYLPARRATRVNPVEALRAE